MPVKNSYARGLSLCVIVSMMTIGEGKINTEDYRTIWASLTAPESKLLKLFLHRNHSFNLVQYLVSLPQTNPVGGLFHPDGPEMASSKSWKENHLPSHIIPVWNHNASHKMLPSLESFPSSSYFSSRLSLFVSPNALDSPSSILQSLPSRAIGCKLLCHTRSQTTKSSLPWPEKWLMWRDFLGSQKKTPEWVVWGGPTCERQRKEDTRYVAGWR
jgi:hypothetical protein